jgi:Peptidase family M23
MRLLQAMTVLVACLFLGFAAVAFGAGGPPAPDPAPGTAAPDAAPGTPAPTKTTSAPSHSTSAGAVPRPTPDAFEPKVPKSHPLSVTPYLGSFDYVFPVVGGVSFGDTYGAPRSDVPGKWHHGDDIFAPLGAPVVAVADGTLNNIGWQKIGGWRLWLHDGAGNAFYYAHLSAYTPLALHASRVKAGQVLGFIGDTGDAITTPFHLHFEVHPASLLSLGEDGAVNPTNYLQQWRHLGHVQIPRPVHPPLPAGVFGDQAEHAFRQLLTAPSLNRKTVHRAKARPRHRGAPATKRPPLPLGPSAPARAYTPPVTSGPDSHAEPLRPASGLAHTTNSPSSLEIAGLAVAGMAALIAFMALTSLLPLPRFGSRHVSAARVWWITRPTRVARPGPRYALMKRRRLTRRNPNPEPFDEGKPRLEIGQRIGRYVDDAFPERTADSDQAQPGPDEREDEASEPRAEHPLEPGTTRLDGSEELVDEPAPRPTPSQTGLERRTTQLHEHETAVTQAAPERAQTLAEREAALDAREARLGNEQSRLRAIEHALAERNNSLERRTAELTEREARLTQLDEHEGTLAERTHALAEQADQLAQQEAALAGLAEERARTLAGREAALDAKEARFADLATEESQLRALEQELAERNESLERRAAELTEHEARLTEHEARLTEHEARLGRRIRRYAERGYADIEGMETEASA